MGGRRLLVGVAVALVTIDVVAAGVLAATHLRSRPTPQPAVVAPASPETAATALPVVEVPAPPDPPASKPVTALAGCPPPPPPPHPPAPPPWRPSVLVPDAALPSVLPPPTLANGDLLVLAGKGMWIWKLPRTEGGDPAAIAKRAQAAGLHQLWVRVGDSRDGFYAGPALETLVPAAHRAGLAVIGWGFPYLWDPVGDSAWSRAALAWRSSGGDALDGFSADIEGADEGVVLSGRRATLYLGLVRQAARDRPLVATVFRPNDFRWASYPYGAIAAYVDAFAPMVYWGCLEPGAAAAQAVARLSTLRPVHVIGQSYNMASEDGRPASPSPAETRRFLDVSLRSGAMGASFWDWQEMTDAEWGALTAFEWRIPARPRAS